MDKTIINWNNACVSNEFFPMITFKDGVFDNKFYQELKNSFPNFKDFNITESGQAHRKNIDFNNQNKINIKVIKEKYPAYHTLYTYLTSTHFKKSVFDRFDKDVLHANGFRGNINNINVSLQVCESTDGYENPFHVDKRKRIVHGLVYFGLDNIKSGGEFCIAKHQPLELKMYPQYPELNNLIDVKTFPPSDNFGLFILSTPNSYHKGNATIGTRRFLYISIDYVPPNGSRIAWECGWNNKIKPFDIGLKKQKNNLNKYNNLQNYILNGKK